MTETQQIKAGFFSRTKNSKDDWETPQPFFDLLNKAFHFTIDGCASATNAKCPRFFSEEVDGLKQSWNNEKVFINPPFSKIDEFLKKAYEETEKNPSCKAVFIIPARTDTKYFHEICQKAKEIWFCKGRVNFLLKGQKTKNGSTFPLMVVIFESHLETTTVRFWDWKKDLKVLNDAGGKND